MKLIVSSGQFFVQGYLQRLTFHRVLYHVVSIFVPSAWHLVLQSTILYFSNFPDYSSFFFSFFIVKFHCPGVNPSRNSHLQRVSFSIQARTNLIIDHSLHNASCHRPKANNSNKSVNIVHIRTTVRPMTGREASSFKEFC